MPITIYHMLTVKFQSPTRGPLITVTDITEAFVVNAAPGVKLLKDVAAGARLTTPVPTHAGFFAAAAPYILPLICSGDTSESVAPADASVSLPDDVSPVVASELAQLADDLEKQIASSSVLNPDQKTFLNQLLAMVRTGRLGLDRLLENIWTILTDDMLNHAESLGATVQKVAREGRDYNRIQYDPANAELTTLLAPLLHVLLAFQFKIPDPAPLIENSKLETTIYLPTWKTMLGLYQPHLFDIVWVAKSLDAEEKIPLFEANLAPVRIVLERLHEMLEELGAPVHPLIFMMYELYHALSSPRLVPEKRAVLDMLKQLISTDVQYADGLLPRMISLAVRLSSPMTDQQLADALWEVLELDLALRAMKAGAAVEISDDLISISGSVNSRELEDLMNEVLVSMHAMRKRGSTVVRVNQHGKTRSFNLVRWSKFKPTFGPLRTISWEDYADTLRQDVRDLNVSFDSGHPMAMAWETLSNAW